jgi:hypothetical protein
LRETFNRDNYGKIKALKIDSPPKNGGEFEGLENTKG